MRPKILNEPTFYFLLLAALISVSYWLLDTNSRKPLQIDAREIEAKILVTELSQGFPASDEQRQQIEADLVDDYVLVLEAYEVGLQNDARINDILAQKMRHFLSGNIIQPTDAELEAFYTDHIDLYTSESRVTTDELVFDSRDPLPVDLLGQLSQGTEPENLASGPNWTRGTLPQVTQRDLSNIFNDEIATAVFADSSGTWIGPYLSNRGQHWLRVQESFPPFIARLADVSDRVRLDWIAVEEDARLQVEIEQLRSRYDITIVESE